MPYRAGAHAGTTGPFVILDFEEPTDPATVYVETLAGDIYLEERSDVNRYTLAFDRLRAASLHPDDSVQLIEQAASTIDVAPVHRGGARDDQDRPFPRRVAQEQL